MGDKAVHPGNWGQREAGYRSKYYDTFYFTLNTKLKFLENSVFFSVFFWIWTSIPLLVILLSEYLIKIWMQVLKTFCCQHLEEWHSRYCKSELFSFCWNAIVKKLCRNCKLVDKKDSGGLVQNLVIVVSNIVGPFPMGSSRVDSTRV